MNISLNFCYAALPAENSNSELALSNGTDVEDILFKKLVDDEWEIPRLKFGGAVYTRWAAQIVHVLVVLEKYILEWPARRTTLTKAVELTFSVCQKILNFTTTFDQEYRDKVTYMELNMKHPSSERKITTCLALCATHGHATCS